MINRSIWFLLLSIVGVGNAALPMQAQSITPAADGTGTVVQQTGNAYEITGGSASSDGSNLFHSFDRFNVLSGESASFTSPVPSSPLTIFGLVRGGEASLIEGAVSASGITNLVLVNPAGLLTGVNGEISSPGTLVVTTAAELGFLDGDLDALTTTDFSAFNGELLELHLAADAGAIINEGSMLSNLSGNPARPLILVGGTVLNSGGLASTPSAPTPTAASEGVAVISGGASTAVTLNSSLPSISLGSNSLGNALLNVPAPAELLLQRSSVPAESVWAVDSLGTVSLAGEAIAPAVGSTVLAGTGDNSATNLTVIAQEDVIATQALSASHSITIKALGGDVVVSTLTARQGGIDIFAAERFQATGAVLLDSNGLSGSVALDEAPSIQAFLESKGITVSPGEEANVVFATDSDASGVGDVPHSILVRPSNEGLEEGDLNAPVTIRFGGATRTLIDQQFDIPSNGIDFDGDPTTNDDPNTVGRILVEGGDEPFFSGPAPAGTLLSGLNDPFVIRDSGGDFVEVTTANYVPGTLLYANVTYDTTFPSEQFPAETNGVNAGIIVGFGPNSSLYGFVQDRSFDALPSGGGPVVTNPTGPTDSGTTGGGTTGGGTAGGGSSPVVGDATGAGGSGGGALTPQSVTTIATRGPDDVTRGAEGESNSDADLALCAAQQETAEEAEDDALTESIDNCPNDRDPDQLLGNIALPELPEDAIPAGLVTDAQNQ